MDKKTYGQYGWIVIVVIIICILISTMPGIGMIIKTDIQGTLGGFRDATDKSLDNVTLDGEEFGDGVDTTKLVPGLYYTGTDVLIKDWDTLIDEEIIGVVDGALYLDKGYNVYAGESASLYEDDSVSLFGLGGTERYLSGDLVVAPGVTSIGDYGFESALLFTAIVLPDSVVSIGGNAFGMCPDFKSITFGKNVASIGDVVFAESGIEKIKIPKSVESIGTGILAMCNNLESIKVEAGNPIYYSVNNCLIDSTTKTVIAACNSSVIPDGEGITGIAPYTFVGLKNLKKVHIPSTLVTIEDGCFMYSCGIKTITVDPDSPTYLGKGNCLIEKASKTLILGSENSVIPDDGSVTTIAEGVFEEQTIPSSFTLPGSVKTVKMNAFALTTGISTLIVEDGVETIGEYAFYGSSVSNVTIAGSVTTVESSAFADCKKLKEVTLLDGFARIGNYMFDFSSIEKITIPESVTGIAAYAFNLCDDLKDIYYAGTKAQWNAISFGDNWNEGTSNYTIHCTDGDITKS